MVACARCGPENPDQVDLCAACGSKLFRGTIDCATCGRPIAPEATCPYCGDDSTTTPPGPRKEPMTAGFKALLYAASAFIWIVGVVIGVLYLRRGNQDDRRVGKTCLALGVVSLLVLSAGLYVFLPRSDDIIGDYFPVLSKTPVAGGWRFTLSYVDFDIWWRDLTVWLTDGDAAVTWVLQSSSLVGVGAVTASCGEQPLSGTVVTLSVTDQSGNDKIDEGDYFVLTSSPGFDIWAMYEVRLVSVTTGNPIVAATFSG